MIVCQLLLTAALTAASVLYARVELRRAFDAALEGRATSTLALVRYTESDPPDLLFDPSLLPPSSDSRAERPVRDSQATGKWWRDRTETSAAGRRAAEAAAICDFELRGVPYRAVTLRNVAVLDNEDDAHGPRG